MHGTTTMTPLWATLHFAGFAAWLGGLLAILVLRGGAAREPGAVTDLSPVYRALVGPGAMLTVVTGLMLTLRLYGEASGDGLGSGLMAMQGLGLVAAMISLVVSVPTASRLSRLEPVGPSATLHRQLDRRLRLTDLLVLVMGTVAIATGTLGR